MQREKGEYCLVLPLNYVCLSKANKYTGDVPRSARSSAERERREERGGRGGQEGGGEARGGQQEHK